mmetsp:Transcript_6872/g.11797  ORF Transcript_6872/g.11797 Transcript_6872/m.11797 type:complete len:386 (-) Transcript_6872:425-1582(-)|eukprot:CAMPEP_0196653610 /NCGR_PEP_ID=MMETSP1086-20130531/3266_1 /TAXON_ID=77921 /ORGANISM="Cyanoptyche  gloeocystis , Strain SAG4.97" /LENGTH=385 /DNA_ID=CAMNT_0041984903 /DNA_START=39 /DNA_END=1196 /DNA_ORIENTATION=+
MVVGKLHVNVVGANLQYKEKRSLFGLVLHKLRPICRVSIAGTVSFKTDEPLNGSPNNPEWNKTFVFFVTERLAPYLEIAVLDSQKLDVVGTCRIRFDRMVFYGKNNQVVDKWYHLKRHHGRTVYAAGQIHLKVWVEFDPAYLARAQALQQAAQKQIDEPPRPPPGKPPAAPTAQQPPTKSAAAENSWQDYNPQAWDSAATSANSAGPAKTAPAAAAANQNGGPAGIVAMMEAAQIGKDNEGQAQTQGQNVTPRTGDETTFSTEAEAEAYAHDYYENIVGDETAANQQWTQDANGGWWNNQDASAQGQWSEQGGEASTASTEAYSGYMWEYKWTEDGTDVYGPYTTPQMIEWYSQGHFQGDKVVWCRVVGQDAFYSSEGIDFRVYA